MVSLDIAHGMNLTHVLITKYTASAAGNPGILQLADGRTIYWDATLVGILCWQIEPGIL